MIIYIPEPIRKTLGGSNDKVVSLFKTNTPKNYDKQLAYQRGKKQADQRHKDNLNKS